jgi:hypothetical protein
VTAISDARLPGAEGRGSKWHLPRNGVFRQAVAYQTGSGAHARKTRLGVGRAATAEGSTWWVCLFGE